jgi:choline-sulfatase
VSKFQVILSVCLVSFSILFFHDHLEPVVATVSAFQRAVGFSVNPRLASLSVAAQATSMGDQDTSVVSRIGIDNSRLSQWPLTRPPATLSPKTGEGGKSTISTLPSPPSGERGKGVRGYGAIGRVCQIHNTSFVEHNGLFAAAQRPGIPKSNVILITIDTLRPDHLGCYGYKAIQTPHIDKLASESARFTTVVSQVPQTLPSHCTILTSTYPMFHGIRDNVGYKLDDSKTTLAEVLKRQGFQTGAFVGSFVLDSRFGLSQGFDTYDDHFNPEKNPDGFLKLEELERRAEEVVDHAVQWLEKTNSSSPFFAWIHLYDPHDPYDPPPPFKARYRSKPYDGEIAYTDEQVGKLMAFLNRKGLYDKTLIVLTGDHGESFGEHREFKHGYFLYDTTLLVPLLIKPVRQLFGKQIIEEQVRLVDIAPTILQILELPKVPDFQGTGLLGLMAGKQKQLELEAYSETYYPAQFGASSLRSLRRLNTKFIEAPRPELYDLNQDPSELKNVYTENQALANQLKNRLGEMSNMLADKGSEKNSQMAPSSEELEKLGALGYVGGPVRAGKAEPQPSSVSDPKDRLDIFQLLSEAGRNAATGRCAQAEKQFLEAIEKAPGISTAYFLLGRCYFNEQKFDSAYGTFQQLLKLNPESAEARFYVAACEFYLGKLDSAEAGLQKVLSQNPDHIYAHKYLGLIYQSRGQFPQALDQLSQVINRLPNDEEANYRIGFLLARQSKFGEAAAAFQKVIQLNPSNAAAHHNLGLAYLRTNQNDLAQQELSQACKLDSRFCKN